MLAAEVQALDGKALLEIADRLKDKLGDAAIVLGSAGENRVDLVASVAPALVAARRPGRRDRQAGRGRGRAAAAAAATRWRAPADAIPAELPAALEAARGGDRAAARDASRNL